MDNLGFIHEKLDIKILILFILGGMNQKVDANTLTELCLCDEGISYFDYTECLLELAQTGHISHEDGLYEITEKGRKNGKITESSVAYSVRIKVEKQMRKLKQQLRRNAMITSDYTEHEGGGYKVNLTLSDGIGDIMSIELLAGDKTQAKALCNGFRNRAEQVYTALIDELLDA